MATPTSLPGSFSAGAVLTAAQMNNLRGAFRVLQVVRATDTTTRTTTSATYVDASLSVTITPQATSSNVLLIAVFLGLALNTSTGANQAQYQITTSGNTALSGAEGALIGTVNYTQSSGYAYAPVNMFGWSSPNTTSATTYKVRYRAASSNTTAYMANGDMTAQLYALEISA